MSEGEEDFVVEFVILQAGVPDKWGCLFSEEAVLNVMKEWQEILPIPCLSYDSTAKELKFKGKYSALEQLNETLWERRNKEQ